MTSWRGLGGEACAILLLVRACLPAPALAVGRCEQTIRLEVDDLFSKPELAEIAKAVANWTAASGKRLCFRTILRATARDGGAFRSDGRFTIYSPRRPWQVDAATTIDGTPCRTRGSCLAVTIWEHGGRISDVFVLTLDLRLLRATVEHEIGHLLGMRHTVLHGSVMDEGIGAARHVGDLDREVLACLLRTRSVATGHDACAPEAIRSVFPVAPRAGATSCAPATGASAPTTTRSRRYCSLVRRARLAGERGNAPEALRLFGLAKRLGPTGVEALTGLGYCRLDQGRFSSARANFSRALALAPTDGDALIGMAETHRLEGSRDMAAQCYRAYLREHTDGHMAAMVRGTLASLGREGARAKGVADRP